jgi:hypothetical protein
MKSEKSKIVLARLKWPIKKFAQLGGIISFQVRLTCRHDGLVSTDRSRVDSQTLKTGMQRLLPVVSAP